MSGIWRYLRLWWKLTENSFLSAFQSRLGAGLFIIGKVLRFIFFGIFLLAIFSQVKMLANYSFGEAMFFYLTFNFLDTLAQLLFREAYRFRELVVRGDFDIVLSRPANPLFRALVGGADPLDLLMLFPYVGLLIYTGGRLEGVTAGSLMTYLLLLVNGMMIATGFHILILALGIITTEIDHAVMIYRDIASMGRVPVDIYREPVRSLITFVIPVGLMMTVPVKGLLGLIDSWNMILVLTVSLSFFWVCIRVWQMALNKYASASS